MKHSLSLFFKIETGLSPSSQYRVTVRAKPIRAAGQAPQIPPAEEAPGAYTDFRTLAKGLPDPPQVNFPFNSNSVPLSKFIQKSIK